MKKTSTAGGWPPNVPATSMNLDALKQEMLRPAIQLAPLMEFRGQKNPARIHALWNWSYAAYLNECEDIGAITKLYREGGELPHFCGLHAKYLDYLSVRSFFSRVVLSPKVKALVPDFGDYIASILPYVFQLTRVANREHQPKKLRVWKNQAKPDEIRYLFGPQSPERDMLVAVHEAVPKGVNAAIRNDLCQDLLCEIIAGDLKLENVRDAIGARLRAAKAFMPHSMEDFGRKPWTGDKGADEWKDWYVPPPVPLAEKVEWLSDHWGCGNFAAPPAPQTILPKHKMVHRTETRQDFEIRVKRRRAREMGLIQPEPLNDPSAGAST